MLPFGSPVSKGGEGKSPTIKNLPMCNS